LPITPGDFFADNPAGEELFDEIRRVIDSIGKSMMRVSKSQIAFRRKRNFAIVWWPRQYLKRATAPLVLTLSLSERDPSPRWKEITEAAPRRFTHHLELRQKHDIDGQVKDWLREAWGAAG
jgi:hypothetical protein